MKYFCNPLNVPYRYQFNASPNGGPVQIAREGADPSLICFKGRYYLFPSMNLSVWVSDDLANWEAHRLPENLPLYDYAPDVRVIGEYVYFCASKRLAPAAFTAQKTRSTARMKRSPVPLTSGTRTFSATMTAVSISTGAATASPPSGARNWIPLPCSHWVSAPC